MTFLFRSQLLATTSQGVHHAFKNAAVMDPTAPELPCVSFTHCRYLRNSIKMTEGKVRVCCIIWHIGKDGHYSAYWTRFGTCSLSGQISKLEHLHTSCNDRILHATTIRSSVQAAASRKQACSTTYKIQSEAYFMHSLRGIGRTTWEHACADMISTSSASFHFPVLCW